MKKPNRAILIRLFAATLPLVLGANIVLAEKRSPYAGEETRSIKSLSVKEIRSLRAGAGMGFAKLAELNHYPGPKHVLAIADQLELSMAQRESTESLYNEMRQAAIKVGEQLIEAERRLDIMFRDASINEDLLENALLEIGELRARLRFVHLETHLQQRRILTGEQVEKYDAIRGY